MEIYVERYSALEAGWRGVTSAFVVGNVPDYRLCTGEDDRSRKSAENNTYIVEIHYLCECKPSGGILPVGLGVLRGAAELRRYAKQRVATAQPLVQRVQSHAL